MREQNSKSRILDDFRAREENTRQEDERGERREEREDECVCVVVCAVCAVCRVLFSPLSSL